MGIYLNPGNDLFKMALNSRIYVDKSLIVKELDELIDTTDNLICVSRPRRFGKTMAASLISAFYSKGCQSRALFEGLKIAKVPGWDKNLNKFNVIKIDVNGFFSWTDNPEDIVTNISKSVNAELKNAFPSAGIEGEDNLATGLTKVFAATGEKFILLMDEYDVMVREKVSLKAFELYLKFLNSLFKNSNLRPAIHLAYLTGILPIVRDKIQSKLNEFIEYSMTDAKNLSGFVGFTEDEVLSLCQKYSMDFAECKRWYNGYKLGKIDAIYSPRSVVSAMTNRSFKDYWTKTGSYESLKNYILLNFKGIRDDIIAMIGGQKVKVDVLEYLNTMTDFRSKDDVFTYLIHLGYLAYDEEKEVCFIPNNEIRSEWILSINKEEQYSNIIEMVNESEELLNRTVQGDAEYVAAALDKSHAIATNPKTYNNEGGMQASIGLAYFYARQFYTFIQELPTGKGYADIVMLPVHLGTRPAIIVELKMNKTTDTALAQIKNKNYGKDLEHYTGDMLLVGINYDAETKKHECLIEKAVKGIL